MSPKKDLDLQIISELTCAYFLGKMVEMPPVKRERVRFDNYSTSTWGLRRKNLTEQTFLLKDSVTK